MITEDMKKAIQNEVKKQLGILKEKDGAEKKELTPYQKTIKLLKSYRYYKNRIEYLRNNLDNIEIKKKYSIGEIKVSNNSNLSEMERKEIIKEEKYKEIIPIIYFEKIRMEDVAEKFSVDTSTIKRNRNKLVEIMSLSIFDSEILKDLIKNIF